MKKEKINRFCFVFIVLFWLTSWCYYWIKKVWFKMLSMPSFRCILSVKANTEGRHPPPPPPPTHTHTHTTPVSEPLPAPYRSVSILLLLLTLTCSTWSPDKDATAISSIPSFVRSTYSMANNGFAKLLLQINWKSTLQQDCKLLSPLMHLYTSSSCQQGEIRY